MRITNGMMLNNSLRDINNNKINVDRYSTQFSTEKKIQKPSDDPIVAIRALRFRSNLAEITQYLERNIPDAESWLKLTEDALISARDMTHNILEDITQGATDTLGTSERASILKNLQAYRDQIFQSANADYANRTIFTGYKTNSTMTFESNEPNTKYFIKEELTFDNVDEVRVVLNNVDTGNIGYISEDEMPYTETNYRIRLAYGGLNPNDWGVNVVDEDGNEIIKPIYIKIENGKYIDCVANSEVENPYDTKSNGWSYLFVDSGEMIISEEAYRDYTNAINSGKKLSVEYQKTGFEKGDLRPEHFFKCTKETDGGTETFEYSGEPQDIEYTVNFGQKMKINTEGRDVFSHDIIRDIDEMINCVSLVDGIEKKISDIEKKISVATSPEEKAILEDVKGALEKEFSLADDIMQKRFESALTEFQGHQHKLDLAITEVGNRGVRLKLNKERLTSQQTNIEELKSKNEDTDLPETAILLRTAKDVYTASLSAAAKLLENSLIDFL